MGKKSTVKKRNPNDATFRNIRALKKRVEQLEIRVAQMILIWLNEDKEIPPTAITSDAHVVLTRPQPIRQKPRPMALTRYRKSKKR